MSKDAIKEYIQMLWKRYQTAGKKDRSLILDELVRNLEIHRKAAIRMMNKTAPPKKRPGRKQIYSKVTFILIANLWRQMGYMGSLKLKYALADWLPFFNDMRCTEKVRQELLSMSVSTIERALKPHRADLLRKKNTGTKPWHLKSLIPIKTFEGQYTEPGIMEGDTVAHCGGSLSGSFAWTLTVTDIFSNWTENRAVWNKAAGEVVAQIRDIENNLPFKITKFSSDNGTEFINHQLKHELTRENRVNKVEFTRARAYRKNDQCYVEQKNNTHVRELLGYGRIDNRDCIELMNDIYKNYWSILQNYFVPQAKLKLKVRVGARYKKQYFKPMTPSDRLIGSGIIPLEVKAMLDKTRRTINPFTLKAEMEVQLKKLRRMIELEPSIPIAS